jgi:hypothetical protein
VVAIETVVAHAMRREERQQKVPRFAAVNKCSLDFAGYAATTLEMGLEMGIDHGSGVIGEVLDDLSAAFAEVGRHVVLDDARVDTDLVRGEALRYFTRLFAAGLTAEVEFHDPAYPNLTSFLTPWLNWGYPNPDGRYHWTMLSGEYTYRVWGNRGTHRLLDIEVWEGDLANMNLCSVVGGFRHIAGGKSDLHIEEDGSFEVTLSRDEQPGNWLPLPEGKGHIYIREWFYDLENEQAGKYYIERVGATYPPPAPGVHDHVDGYRRLIAFLRSQPDFLRRGVDQHYASEPGTVAFPASLLTMDSGREVAFRNQVYARGVYECQPDEAVIMEVEPPQAQYWLFVLMSNFWEHFDWRGRQISINGHEAVIDSDGKFRAVIAHADPGVPNWLDTYGHPRGLIGGRYNWTETVPEPTLTTVKLADLFDHLPADTKRTSHEERQAVLRSRLINGRRIGIDA